MAYLHVWLIVVSHGQCRELRADLDHGIVEDSGIRFVVVEALDCFPDKVEAETALIAKAAEEIRYKGIVVGVWLAPEKKSGTANATSAKGLTRIDRAW